MEGSGGQGRYQGETGQRGMGGRGVCDRRAGNDGSVFRKGDASCERGYAGTRVRTMCEWCRRGMRQHDSWVWPWTSESWHDRSKEGEESRKGRDGQGRRREVRSCERGGRGLGREEGEARGGGGRGPGTIVEGGERGPWRAGKEERGGRGKMTGEAAGENWGGGKTRAPKGGRPRGCRRRGRRSKGWG